LCGLSRQRVNLALHRLSDAGLVQLHARGLTVLDVDGLRHFALGS
jgi:DNA-binding GntR family transcriptional regulator